MSYEFNEVETYLFLFDLPIEDKQVLANFEGFDTVEMWEQDKHNELEILANNPDKNVMHFFPKISTYFNQNQIHDNINFEELSKIHEKVIKKLKIDFDSDDDYNIIHFETLVIIELLRNYPKIVEAMKKEQSTWRIIPKFTDGISIILA